MSLKRHTVILQTATARKIKNYRTAVFVRNAEENLFCGVVSLENFTAVRIILPQGAVIKEILINVKYPV